MYKAELSELGKEQRSKRRSGEVRESGLLYLRSLDPGVGSKLSGNGMRASGDAEKRRVKSSALPRGPPVRAQHATFETHPRPRSDRYRLKAAVCLLFLPFGGDREGSSGTARRRDFLASRPLPPIPKCTATRALVRKVFSSDPPLCLETPRFAARFYSAGRAREHPPALFLASLAKTGFFKFRTRCRTVICRSVHRSLLKTECACSRNCLPRPLHGFLIGLPCTWQVT